MADRDDEDVRSQRLPRQVGRARVAHRDGRVRLEEQHRDGLAHEWAPAQHDGLLPGQWDPVLVEQRHDAEGRRGHERLVAEIELARVERVQPVDVLDGLDRPHDAGLVELRRERRLHEDPVDRVVLVELAHELEQLALRGLRR